LFDLPLDAARDFLARIERSEEWGPGPMDGVAILPVMTGARHADALATFTRFDPGVVFPLHAHIGGEVTLVVEGGFRDSSGAEIWRGDELYKPPGSEHDFVIVSEGVCIAAALAIRGIDLR
jgi:putative transcriptional regulator